MLFLPIDQSIQAVVSYVAAFAFLIPSLVTDIKKKKISVPLCIAGILTGIVLSVVFGDVRASLTGLIPGLCLTAIAYLSKEAIGTGDGLIFTMIGSLFGFWKSIAVLFTALLFAMVIALILLVIKRAGRKTEFPFVPFLLAGVAVSVFV